MTLGQVAVMAAIVATILYFPFGGGALLVFHIAGVAIEPWVTFGGTLGLFAGLVGWWLLFFAGGLVYAACMFPWRDEVFGWPRKK